MCVHFCRKPAGQERTRFWLNDMSKEIVPRWEWRTFGETFDGSSDPFAAYPLNDVHDSDEIYLLSAASIQNVKVRDNLIDIKTLQHTNADGLEQWMPVMKHGFPLPEAVVRRIFEELHVGAFKLARVEYTLQQLLDESIASLPAMRAVKIHKTRRRYTVEGCMAEATEITAEQKKTRTVAMELEDAARVIATVRKLGWEHYENTSYPKGLKRLVGMAS
jgi:exopolyphosphatase / guanosine-5'-triphosphate,3'-diphosphate pyrophosphatase